MGKYRVVYYHKSAEVWVVLVQGWTNLNSPIKRAMTFGEKNVVMTAVITDNDYLVGDKITQNEFDQLLIRERVWFVFDGEYNTVLYEEMEI